MRVLIAPDSFSGTLTAAEAAAAIAAGWAQQAGADTLETCPLSDGGPGVLAVLHAVLGGTLLSVTVPGPVGGEVPATVLVRDGTAYVEAAQACGPHLVPQDRRDPTAASTAGVGTLLAAAAQTGARRVVVAVARSAAADGGEGMLRALGAGEDLGGLPDLRRRWADVELVLATDSDLPLLGFKGAAAHLTEADGVSRERAQDLDRRLGAFAADALRVLGPQTAPQRLVAEAGAGAGGGLGFALMLLGARREGGARTVLDAVGLGERLRGADLVVTGEGTLDWRSLRHGVVPAVAAQALDVGVPVVVLAGQVEVGRRELLSIGVEAAYPVAETPDQLRVALADPAGTLIARARRVARTWSR